MGEEGEEETVIARAKALYDYESIEHIDLGLSEGDVVVVTNNLDDDWWEGYVEGSEEKTGVFPATYVQLGGSDSAVPAPAPAPAPEPAPEPKPQPQPATQRIHTELTAEERGAKQQAATEASRLRRQSQTSSRTTTPPRSYTPERSRGTKSAVLMPRQKSKVSRAR
jgi:hypothetical protein